jgi:glutamate synthase domain-containing protein 1/glutamate synthase domain-containing protein 3
VSNKMLERLLLSRARLVAGLELPAEARRSEEEGGCGVVGFCCTEQVPGRHIHEPSRQMHNRGNGKGGGVAAAGFVPEQLGVSRKVLDEYYMIHIALLDAGVHPELEEKYIRPNFEVATACQLETLDDWTSVDGLEVKPPDVWRYFVRVKPEVLQSFINENGFTELDRSTAEDEFVSQNNFRLNHEFYTSLGTQRAFVLSQGKNIMILKIVGYAEAVTKYYRIEDLCAHVWIAHQRFPTKGRVWHPGGAHPFGSINTALVHNGDFANYHSISEYLAQRKIYPQFLTDTEVSVLLFDLLDRSYRYPLEHIIEAIAPTSELDFDRLPEAKQRVYRAIQATHMHGSPDGPWFFIIARSLPEEHKFQLLGITDTAMLRPQVFAFSDGEIQVGLICSEKQAIDATLLSLSREDSRICPVADRYWNARGGSHTNGGAFIFNMEPDTSGKMRLTCTDKFGISVPMPSGTEGSNYPTAPVVYSSNSNIEAGIRQCFDTGDGNTLFEHIRDHITGWSFQDIAAACRLTVRMAANPSNTATAIAALTRLNDLRYPTGTKKRSHLLHIVRSSLHELFTNLTPLDSEYAPDNVFRLIDYQGRDALRPPRSGETTLVIDVKAFHPEGGGCDAALLLDAYLQGWRHFISFNCAGQRFTGCGLGPDTKGVTIDVYDSSGDYLGSGIDGLTIMVHGNAQDQVGQIIKSGKLVIYGDTGQTFMYGAKGGSVYVMGNAAGRPLINSVGKPRVVINGTCLDFLAESFMAGDALNGGGFVVLNGITFNDDGDVIPLAEPYPGSNLFSLASGGAIYIRDPERCVVPEQLNGGQFTPLTDEDWGLIRPYLEENERLFGIKVDDLLTVNGERHSPLEIYRKVAPVALASLGAKGDDYDDSN